MCHCSGSSWRGSRMEPASRTRPTQSAVRIGPTSKYVPHGPAFEFGITVFGYDEGHGGLAAPHVPDGAFEVDIESRILGSRRFPEKVRSEGLDSVLGRRSAVVLRRHTACRVHCP